MFAVVLALFVLGSEMMSQSLPGPLVSLNPNGRATTISTNGSIDLSNPFFKNMGSNGRTCLSCHVPSQGWSVSPPDLAVRFLTTLGKDPIFRPVDGAVCPSAKVATLLDRVSAYRLLLKKGLIRISLPVPNGAEFSIIAIHDPYSCSDTTYHDLALYRRPLPSTNLSFLSAVMWDGRETIAGQTIHQDLGTQALDATTGHAQATVAPTPDQLRQIVNFETALYTAQTYDNSAGQLTRWNKRRTSNFDDPALLSRHQRSVRREPVRSGI
jgi:hypothetical protein